MCSYLVSLLSIVTNGIVITYLMYLYYVYIFNSTEDIPKQLLILQLALCIFGTLWQLNITLVGRLLYWMKIAFVWTIIVSIFIISMPFYILEYILMLHEYYLPMSKLSKFLDITGIRNWHLVILSWVRDNILKPLFESKNCQPSLSSTFLLTVDVLLDILNLVVMYLIEGIIKPNQRLSGIVIFNIICTIISIGEYLSAKRLDSNRGSDEVVE